MFVEQALRMFAGLLVGIWVARYLGPQQFGVFSYALAFTAVFTSIAKLGLDGILVRDLVSDPDKKSSYLGTAFWLKLFAGLLSIALLAVALLFTSNDLETRQYIFIIATGLIFQSFEVIDFYFQAQVLVKYVSVCKIIQLALSSLIKIGLVLTKSPLIWFVWVSLFDQAALAITLVIAYYLHSKSSFFGRFDFSVAKSLIKNSWPLLLSALVTMIYMRIDQVMIKEMLGEHELGIYSAAVRLSEVWYFVPTLVSASLFPAILNAKKTSNALYFERMQRLFVFLVWISIGIAIPITLFSQWLVVFLYGESYRSAGHILVINVWASVFVSLFMVSGRWLVAENLARHALQRNVFAVFINIGMNLILIREYGVIGAACAYLLAMVSASVVYDLFFKDTRPIFILKIKAFFPFIIKS